MSVQVFKKTPEIPLFVQNLVRTDHQTFALLASCDGNPQASDGPPTKGQ